MAEYAIPGPGSAAFLAAAIAAWAASQVNVGGTAGTWTRGALVALVVMLTLWGLVVERMHTRTSLERARIENDRSGNGKRP